MSVNKIYKIAFKEYMLFGRSSEKKLKVYKNHKILFNERFPYDEGYGITFESFELTSFSYKENKSYIVIEQKLEAKITASLIIYEDNGNIKEQNIEIAITHKKDEETAKEPKTLGGLFIFNDIKNDFFKDDGTAKRFFEKKIIQISHAVYQYMLTIPPKRNTYLQRVKNKLTPEVGLMAYNSINQQMVQKSFRDIDTAKQADDNYKTTAKGLEMSLSTMILPTAKNTIYDVELDGAFRISFV